MTASTLRPPPIIATTDSPPTSLLLSWTHVNDNKTIKIMNTIHSGSPSDPCPHHIFNNASSIIAPQLRKIINSSLETASFLESRKHAKINALLKKPKADPKDLKNFWPISLLPFPAKIIEKIVNKQLTHFLEGNNTPDPSQSGFRCNHSTEIALLATTNDIRTILGNGKAAALILLDVSASSATTSYAHT
ncbi:hypothetical protein NDU88_004523 [Pleurodeles waltl]|uniref:Reverse transcriptase domain-containing protein n=1 Tax=Pleurodeles waltl TaxID=8319 RepID=A0AAV7QCA4_PLEWA|nr:hypothetical protein NDU88_004523 [Pleurodeles waltl]